MRFAPRNRVKGTTTTTGTGPYVIGTTSVGYQGFMALSDGDVFPYWIQYGSNWECGIGTKSGSLILRTKVLESTNGNGAVNWGPGTKNIGIDWLAQNVAKSSDGSITISDDEQDGKTNFRGLKLSDVAAWLAATARAGVDIELGITNPLAPTAFEFSVLRKAALDADSGIITLDFSKDIGSTHTVTVGGDRQLRFTNHQVGQELLVKLNYDPAGFRKILWPDQEDVTPATCIIEWVNGYRPEFTPVGGGSDTFKFQRVGDYGLLPKFVGWILSTERPVTREISTYAEPEFEFTTITNGVRSTSDTVQWLSATIDDVSDRNTFRLFRTGTVTGGTFELSLQRGTEQSYTIPSIAHSVTAAELIQLIHEQTPFTGLQIQFASGTNGSLCGSRLTDTPGEIHIELIGPDRYHGYVLSIDSTFLIGGGNYDVDASIAGDGDEPWRFDEADVLQGSPPVIWPAPFRLEFNGETTGDITFSQGATGIRNALQALPSIGFGNIQVDLIDYVTYVFRFSGTLSGGASIPDEIKFAAGFLPSSYEGQATGQVHGTSRIGTGPQSVNEVQRLRCLNHPLSGTVTVSVFGQSSTFSIFANATEILYQLAYDIDEIRLPVPGTPSNISVTGGPLPDSPILIEFIDDLGATDVPASSVVSTSNDADGYGQIDWSICELCFVEVLSRHADEVITSELEHVHPIPGKTLFVRVSSPGSDFPIAVETVAYRARAVSNEFGNTPAVDEKYRLTASPSATGTYFIRLLGKTVELETGMLFEDIQEAIEAKIGDGVTVSGSFPSEPLEITLTGQYSGNQLSATGQAPPPGADRFKPPLFVLYRPDATLDWTGTLVEWNENEPQYDPAAALRIEFFCETSPLILGKTWFHSGEGGEPSSSLPPGGTTGQHLAKASNADFDAEWVDPGSGGLSDQLVPGYSIEIDHDEQANTFEIHNYWTTETLVDAPTIIIDLDPDKGGDKVVAIAADRSFDVVNEKVGKEFKLQVIQGGSGDAGHVATFLFEIEWLEGFQPVQTPVSGKSDEWHFLCVRERGAYLLPKFKAWVETTERPQPLSDVASPIAANETQEILITPAPTGGTWIVGFMGSQTSPISYNASANSIRLAIQSMLSVGPGNVLVSGGRLGVVPIRLEFVNALGGQNLPQVTVQTDGLQF